MPNNDYANEPNQSRSEEIIQSILDNTEYDEAARSRIEYLLIELKNAIEGGGGGGGVTSYSPLTEKPKIDNHTLQAGNNSSSDLGLQTKIDADHKLSADVIDDTNSTNKFNVKSDWNAASGATSEILNKPTLGTASAKNVPATGDAATGEVVLGSDTRLIDARNAKDVYNWAKQENKPSYSYSEIQNTPTIPDELADLADDSTHRTVTDAEKNIWNAKQNALTFDNAPTSNSDNPVKSGGVYTALSAKQNNLSEAQMAAANSGATADKINKIAVNENNILLSYNLDGQHNLLPLQNGVYSASTSTITITGGVVTLKSVDTSTHSVTVGTVTLKAGTYVLYNRIASNGDIRLFSGGSSIVSGDPSTFTIASDTSVEIKIYTYNTVAETTLQPMLVTEAQYNSGLRDFQPHALPNTELTALEKQNENNILLLENYGGGINKLDCSLSKLKSLNSSSWTWNGNVATIGSQTITVNSDKTLTVHTTNEHGQLSFMLTTLATNQGNLFVSGCPSGGDASTYKIGISNVGYDTGDGKAVPNQTTARQVFIEISANVAVDLTFKPMIIDQSIHDNGFHGYQPYAMSNAELTSEKASIIDVYGRGTEITANADLDDYKNPGRYHSPNSTRSGTLTHSPVSNAGFVLTVEESYSKFGNQATLIQTAEWVDSSSYAVKRRMYLYTQSTSTWAWTEWA